MFNTFLKIKPFCVWLCGLNSCLYQNRVNQYLCTLFLVHKPYQCSWFECKYLGILSLSVGMLRVETNARGIVNQSVHLYHIQKAINLAYSNLQNSHHFIRTIKCHRFVAPSKVSIVLGWQILWQFRYGNNTSCFASSAL